MSKKKRRGLRTAIDLAEGTPTPTKTHFEQVADNFLAALDELEAVFPTFELPHALTRQFIRSHKRFPVQFMRTTVAVVEQSPSLQSVKKMDVTKSRNSIQLLDAFLPIQDRAGRFFKGLANTLDSHRAELAADSLQIYAIAKGLARDPDGADMALHVENMTRDLAIKGRRKRKAPRRIPAPNSNAGGQAA